MTNQDLIDLAHSNLKEWKKEVDFQPTDNYLTSDMLEFHKQGIREGLKLVLGFMYDHALGEAPQVKDHFKYLLPNAPESPSPPIFQGVLKAGLARMNTPPKP